MSKKSLVESSSKMDYGPGKNKHIWSAQEDLKVIETLLELRQEGRIKADNGFKPGDYKLIEERLEQKLPGAGLKAKPHIDSRLRTIKSHFNVVHDMLTGPNCSGFGWDPQNKMVVAEDSVWQSYVQSHKAAAQFRGKSLKHYEDLCTVFGRDRASGKDAETPADVVEELEKEGGDDIGDDSRTDTPTSMSFAHGPSVHPPASDVTSKRKRRKIEAQDVMFEGIKEAATLIATEIRDSSYRLSQAIGQDITDKQTKINEELLKLNGLSMIQRHKATRMIGCDHDTTNIFFTIGDDEKEAWVKALLDGSI